MHGQQNIKKNFPTFLHIPQVPPSRVKLTFEDWTDMLSRNVGKILPFYTAQKPQNSANHIYTEAKAQNRAK